MAETFRSWEELALSRSGLPPVILMRADARLRRKDFSGVVGYRLVETQWWWLGDLYARPYLRWKWMRLRRATEYAIWTQLVKLDERGLIHIAVDEGVKARFRDLRLGRG